MSDTAQIGREWVHEAMREHEAPLLRYASRITGDADLARDVTQDVFLRLCGEDPAALNGRLRPWLYTVCRNRAIELRRKQTRWFRRMRDKRTMTTTTERQDGRLGGAQSSGAQPRRVGHALLGEPRSDSASMDDGPLTLSICPGIAASNGLAASKDPTSVPALPTTVSAADLAEQRDSIGQILHELARLSASQQEAIRLRFEHGLPYKEIAAVMGTTVSNVGVMIHTAIKKLREKLVSEE